MSEKESELHPLEMPEGEEAPSAAKGKRTRSTEPMTTADETLLDEAVKQAIGETGRDRVRQVLRPEGIRKLIGDHREHLRSVEDALQICDRWSPRNEETAIKKDEKTGAVLRLPAGDLNSIKELQSDSIYLNSLNAKIATVWALSKSASGRAEAYLEATKAAAKKAILESKRAGPLREKVTSVEQADSMAKSLKAVREAQEDLLNVQEQAEILGGCYFAIQRQADSLEARARALVSEQSRAPRQ